MADDILGQLAASLRRILDRRGGKAGINADTDLVETGLIDSQALLDLILDVEQQTRTTFDAERIDFEQGVTLRRIAAAFT